jgi:hypothetical protein
VIGDESPKRSNQLKRLVLGIIVVNLPALEATKAAGSVRISVCEAVG